MASLRNGTFLPNESQIFHLSLKLKKTIFLSVSLDISGKTRLQKLFVGKDLGHRDNSHMVQIRSALLLVCSLWPEQIRKYWGRGYWKLQQFIYFLYSDAYLLTVTKPELLFLRQISHSHSLDSRMNSHGALGACHATLNGHWEGGTEMVSCDNARQVSRGSGL